MKFRRAIWLAVGAIALVARLATAADPISGRWEGNFDAMGQIVPFTMELAVKDAGLTGTIDSEHTGHGTLKGAIEKDGTFTMTASFESHQSIAFTGKPTKDGLAGEFKTEGFTAKWTVAKAKPKK